MKTEPSERMSDRMTVTCRGDCLIIESYVSRRKTVRVCVCVFFFSIEVFLSSFLTINYHNVVCNLVSHTITQRDMYITGSCNSFLLKPPTEYFGQPRNNYHQLQQISVCFFLAFWFVCLLFLQR